MVGHIKARVPLFDLVWQEQPAVQVADVAQQLAGSGRPLRRRLGKPFEEEHRQEILEIAVATFGFAGGQLVAQVIGVTAIEEELLLQEVNEHESVKQDRGIPAPVVVVVDALDQVHERQLLALELAIELLRDPLDVKGLFQAVSHC